MKYLIYFIVTYIITYLISYFTMIKKVKKNKNNRNEDESKIPIEVTYLINKFNLDINKINYVKFVRNICLVGSFDMSIAVAVIIEIKNIMFQMLLGFIILIPLIIVSYGLLGKYYKKGEIKNGNEGNRK